MKLFHRTMNTKATPRELDMVEAVSLATIGDDGYHGELEGMKQKAINQDAMIARMLNVQFGNYADDFSDIPGNYPTTDADKLAYILGANVRVQP